MKNKILIVGGYGAVGGSIAKNLAPLFPNQVIIAGRNLSKAERFAKKIAAPVLTLQLDVAHFEESAILEDVRMLIVCLDSTHTKLAEACIQRDIIYLDISAQYETLKQIEALDTVARAHHSTLVLSVGLAPGMTNLLAQYAYKQLQHSVSINIFVLLGLGEKHGEQAYRWTFNQIDSTYTVGQLLTKSFTSPLSTNLRGNRTFYTFDFSDQHVLLRTLHKTAVKTRIAFDLKWFTKLTAVLRTVGITKLFRNKKIQDIAIKMFHKITLGNDVFGVKVEATDQKGDMRSYTFSGNNEGKVTAAFATELALLLLAQDKLPVGVLHTHQIITDIPEFIDKIKLHDASFEFN